MSPRYETRGDLLNEEGVAKIFCLNMNCTYKKVREIDDYSPDVTFWRSKKRVAVGEIKVRTNNKNHYPTYLISASKINSLNERWSPTPFFLIVKWTDEIGWVKVDDDSIRGWKIKTGGREDRNNPKDKELCYLIPIEQFAGLKFDGSANSGEQA